MYWVSLGMYVWKRGRERENVLEGTMTDSSGSNCGFVYVVFLKSCSS